MTTDARTSALNEPLRASWYRVRRIEPRGSRRNRLEGDDGVVMAANEDDKNPERPPQAPTVSSAPRRQKRTPRFETPSELRGFPITRNGTELGVGGPVPGAIEEPDDYYDEDISKEEAEKIDRLFQVLGDDMAGRPRSALPLLTPVPNYEPATRAEGSVRNLTRDTIDERVDRRADTAPGVRAKKARRGLWAWIGLGSAIGVVVALFATRGPREGAPRISTNASPAETSARASAVPSVQPVSNTVIAPSSDRSSTFPASTEDAAPPVPRRVTHPPSPAEPTPPAAPSDGRLNRAFGEKPE
jgi:hypothetical protein